MNYCVMVLAVGDIFYKSDAAAVLKHYFRLHRIPYHFIEHPPVAVAVRGAHPSWWKLLAHSILPGYDFIICWDLDLLPRSPVHNVIGDFDMNSLCIGWDSHAKTRPDERWRPSFKYNGGLIGIPKSYAEFSEDVFARHAPGEWPSYEQYYLNDELEAQAIKIHELPSDVNVLYTFPGFETARLQHYTFTENAKKLIAGHRARYFQPLEFDTRIDMIKSLIKPGSVVCEVGVFKGDMAKTLVQVVDPSMYVMIDLFEGTMGSGDQDGNNFEYVNLDVCYRQLLDFFAQSPHVQILKGDGIASLSSFDDELFDMVYLDADHSYEACKRDLALAYKKVKKGGFIMGHDYEMNMKKAKTTWVFGVKQAVDEFCTQHGLFICAKGFDGCVSYAIQKLSD
jgi:hypothetical protein